MLPSRRPAATGLRSSPVHRNGFECEASCVEGFNRPSWSPPHSRPSISGREVLRCDFRPHTLHRPIISSFAIILFICNPVCVLLLRPPRPAAGLPSGSTSHLSRALSSAIARSAPDGDLPQALLRRRRPRRRAGVGVCRARAGAVRRLEVTVSSTHAAFPGHAVQPAPASPRPLPKPHCPFAGSSSYKAGAGLVVQPASRVWQSCWGSPEGQ